MQTNNAQATPLEIRPAPPEPTRLNRRAGLAALFVLSLLMAAIVYGVATRQGVGLRMSERDSGAEAATNAGKEIASRVDEGNLSVKPEREQRDPFPLARSTPAGPTVAPDNTELSPEEKLREESWAREVAAQRAGTPIGKKPDQGGGAGADAGGRSRSGRA